MGSGDRRREAGGEAATRFLIGTSGWNYPHWLRRFYPATLPQHAWLSHYARHFRTVEVNYTFYKLPTTTEFAAWRRAVPRSFTFGVKASRFITHIKRLRSARPPVRLLLARAAPLAATLGPILFQLPPTMQFDAERLVAFLAVLPAGRRYAMEFRHESWHRDEGRYTDDGLRRWAERLREISEGARTAYVYFNNDQQAYAVQNAARLAELLPLPSPPRPPRRSVAAGSCG